MFCFSDQAQPVLVPVEKVSLEKCLEVCRGDPACRSLVYQDGGCELHGSFRGSNAVFCAKELFGVAPSAASFRYPPAVATPTLSASSVDFDPRALGARNHAVRDDDGEDGKSGHDDCVHDRFRQ